MRCKRKDKEKSLLDTAKITRQTHQSTDTRAKLPDGHCPVYPDLTDRVVGADGSRSTHNLS